MNHKIFQSIALRLIILIGSLALSDLRSRACDEAQPGAVYTLSNESSGNSILAFRRHTSGAISFANSFPTNGLGAGASLGSQGALCFGPNHQSIYAVNAASRSLSVFRLQNQIHALVQVVDSGGDHPVSVTAGPRSVYVLNSGYGYGGVDQISGFRILPESVRLSPIENSERQLSEENVKPAQISFDPTYQCLVVTEKATNQIVTFSLERDQTAAPMNIFPSSGKVPYGFGFSGKGNLIVSEGATNTVSSYRLDQRTGDLQVITPAASTNQVAPCWIAVTHNGRFAYSANAQSQTISAFHVNSAGRLSLLAASGISATVTGNPVDMAVVGNRFLYVLSRAPNMAILSAFKINENGGLLPIGQVGGLPRGSAGLIAH